MHEIRLRTDRRTQLLDITGAVQDAVNGNGDISAALIFVPHTTAGVTINEHADPAVARDFEAALEKMVSDGRLALGTWQGIFFCEFDGPRERKVYVSILR